MAQANWRREGEWLKNCTCAFGCPCNFNARPTQGPTSAAPVRSRSKRGINRFKLQGASTVALAMVLVAGAGAALAAETIGVADGERSGTRVDITEIKRTSGNTLTLKFTLVNETGGKVVVAELLDHNDARNVHLIDAAGKKKYLPLMDSAGKCVCSASLPYDLASNKSLNLWARFPSPPASVREINVVIPHFIPTDVAIAE